MFGEAWPSSRKRERLRAAGILPFSPFAVAALVMIALLGAGFLFPREWESCLADWHAAFAAAASRDDALRSALFAAERLRGWLICLAATVFFSAALGVLLQTGFFFDFGISAPRMARLNPFRGGAAGGILRRTWFAAVGWIACLAVSFGALRFCLPVVVGILQGDRAAAAQSARRLLETATPAAIAVLGIAAAAGWAWSRVSFAMRHRMTQQEINQEISERE